MKSTTIERGVKRPMNGRSAKYPWERMKVGDSFVVNTNDENYARAGASKRGRLDGRKYSVSKLNGKWRVWRVK